MTEPPSSRSDRARRASTRPALARPAASRPAGAALRVRAPRRASRLRKAPVSIPPSPCATRSATSGGSRSATAPAATRSGLALLDDGGHLVRSIFQRLVGRFRALERFLDFG